MNYRLVILIVLLILLIGNTTNSFTEVSPDEVIKIKIVYPDLIVSTPFGTDSNGKSANFGSYLFFLVDTTDSALIGNTYPEITNNLLLNNTSNGYQWSLDNKSFVDGLPDTKSFEYINNLTHYISIKRNAFNTNLIKGNYYNLGIGIMNDVTIHNTYPCCMIGDILWSGSFFYNDLIIPEITFNVDFKITKIINE
jgi:hypothetical protein